MLVFGGKNVKMCDVSVSMINEKPVLASSLSIFRIVGRALIGTLLRTQLSETAEKLDDRM